MKTFSIKVRLDEDEYALARQVFINSEIKDVLADEALNGLQARVNENILMEEIFIEDRSFECRDMYQ